MPGAPALSITWSQAMVPLGSHDDLARKERPASLAPEPPGHWRWVGTKTLLFEPEDRFPRSTRYEALVPAGVESESGGALEQELRWSFETPRLKLTLVG